MATGTHTRCQAPKFPVIPCVLPCIQANQRVNAGIPDAGSISTFSIDINFTLSISMTKFRISGNVLTLFSMRKCCMYNSLNCEASWLFEQEEQQEDG